MVDPQVDGRHLVARGATRPLPLDDQGQPAAQAVVGGQEGAAVGPRRVELGVVRAAGAQLGEVLPELGRQAAHDGRPRPHGGVDVRRAEHAEPGPELGHRGPIARHSRIFPRPVPAPASTDGRAGRPATPALVGEERGELQLERSDAASCARCSRVLS